MPEKLPIFDNLIDENEFKTLIKNSENYTWMAEYHNACVNAIQTNILGAPKSVVDEINSIVLTKLSYHEGVKNKKFDEKNPLNLNAYRGFSLYNLIWAYVTVFNNFLLLIIFYSLQFNFGCEILEIKRTMKDISSKEYINCFSKQNFHVIFL